jgi:hypothetical protein
MPSKSTLDIRFHVTVKRSSDGLLNLFRAEVQYMTDQNNGNHDSGLRSPCHWDDEPLRGLSDLTISAQANRDHTDRGWYGWEVEYRSIAYADLRFAKAMVKQLGTLDRKMSKLTERFGTPNDLADFCARVADALGATEKHTFGLWHDEITMNGTHYRFTDTDGLRFWLADQKK